MSSSNIPATAPDAAAEIAELREQLERVREAGRVTSEYFLKGVAPARTPEDILRATTEMLHGYFSGLDAAPETGAAWARIFKNPFSVPINTGFGDVDSATIQATIDGFAERPWPREVVTANGKSFVAVPLLDTSLPGNLIGALAIEMSEGSELTESLQTVAFTIGYAGSQQFERIAHMTQASRTAEYAQAAARAQSRLTKPRERAAALSVAVEALSLGNDVIGAVAFEIVEGEPQTVASYGAHDESAILGLAVDRVHGRNSELPDITMLPIVIEGHEEALIAIQTASGMDAESDEMLSGIAAAVAGSVARFRAAETIETLRRSATRRLVEAQERERSMVAADIHDGVLQQLGATAIRLELAQARVEQSDFATASSILEDGAKEIRSCARELRALLMELRPQVLDDNGLTAALNELGRNVKDVEVLVQTDVPDDLGNEYSITIFRIVQEALTNIQKHAQATTANVNVVLRDGIVEIEIRDDGLGYEGAVTGPSAEGSHLGLLGMRERARMLGGSFSIEGQSGTGTVIHARLPVSAPIHE